MLSESHNMPGLLLVLLFRPRPEAAWFFLLTCNAKTERAGFETLVRSFPHLRSCKSRQPRGTKKRQSECWAKAARAAWGGVPGGEASENGERKETKQMPKARRDKMSYERHNRIVHLLKTECSFPAASQTACMPPYSRFLVSHLRVRRMPTDMPALNVCR